MPRIPRLMVEGCPCHLTHRGNHRRVVFDTDEDREVYLRWLGLYARRFGMRIWAYCLMPNHVHLIAVGEQRLSISRAIGNTHRTYSRWRNEARKVTGHLWANRFFSTLMDETHLWAAVRYVELNPVRSGWVSEATAYAWSSARANAGLANDPLLDPARPFPGPIRDWPAWLRTGLDEPTAARIRSNTSTGHPTGNEAFLDDLESRFGRRVRPLRRGRKPTVPARSCPRNRG